VLLVLLVMVLAALVALATGGRFSRLGDLELVGIWWLAAAAGLQAVGAIVGGSAYPVCLLLSAGVMAVFLGGNLHRPGVGLLALGFTGNALVVLLNGAMPVSLDALARAGVVRSAAELALDPRHEETTRTTLLPWLGDVVPVAFPKFGQVVSPGDVLVAAGAGLLLFTAMRSVSRRSELEAEADHAAQ
jgi:hypothetical protein